MDVVIVGAIPTILHGEVKIITLESAYLPPVVIHVVWHPAYSLGREFADAIFRQFCRDLVHPMARGAGIPVFFRSVPLFGLEAAGPPIPIDLEAAEQTLVVAFVEPGLVNADGWDDYLAEVGSAMKKRGGLDRLFQVTVSGEPLALHSKTNWLNHLRLPADPIDVDSKSEAYAKLKTKQLMFELSCAFCKVIDLDPKTQQPIENLRIFLSHARKDASQRAKELNDWLRTRTAIDTYIDVLSIRPGKDFRDEIELGVQDSALLVWLSDAYASREWCRKEVLFAKKHHRPIVLVNAMKNAEVRAFPYLGNVPSIRYRNHNFEDILALMTLEALRFAYFKRSLESVKRSHQAIGLLPSGVDALPHAPELLSFKYLGEMGPDREILYPDPPLGDGEREVLDFVSKGARLVTPIGVLTHGAADRPNRFLQGRKIALSISLPNAEELLHRGFSQTHLLDTLTEFVRYVFSGGGRVLFGGYLEEGSFTNALIELAEGYRVDNRNDAPLLNFLSWPWYLKLNDDQRARLKGVVKFELVHPPAALGVEGKEWSLLQTAPEQFASALSASMSRQKVAKFADAHIVLGGKTEDYKGAYPGLVEEAYYSIQKGIPVFLLGAWGGCAGALVDMLETGMVPQLFKDDVVKAAKNQQGVWAERAYWEGKLEALDDLPKGAEEMAMAILKAGIAGLNNGLTAAENGRLFRTVHVPEMVGLVLKGLGAVGKP